jgi:hypothetical protein
MTQNQALSRRIDFCISARSFLSRSPSFLLLLISVLIMKECGFFVVFFVVSLQFFGEIKFLDFCASLSAF